jgi:putative transcriptional regulator
MIAWSLRARRAGQHNAPMLRRSAFVLCAVSFAIAPSSWARDPAEEPPNAVLLVAKPTLLDPNFSHTVVLATQTREAETVGVILNRPTPLKAVDVLPPELPASNYADVMFFGGPVLRRAVVAVFDSAGKPAAPAFHLLEATYLTMHSDNIRALLQRSGGSYRLYIGFAAWAPHQLEGELLRKDWYVLPAHEDEIFRKDTSGLWKELLERATGAHAARPLSRTRLYSSSGGLK